MNIEFTTMNLQKTIHTSILKKGSTLPTDPHIKNTPANIRTYKSPFCLTNEFNTKELSRDILIGKEIERIRIARDLHDSFGQKLYAIKLFVCALDNLEVDTEQAKIIRQDIKNMLDESIVNLREISNDLAPSFLNKEGLRNTIIQLINRQNLIIQNLITYEIIGLETYQLSETDAVFIFRILEEFICNSLKYSKATNIHIDIKTINNSLHVKLKDNGIGFKMGKVIMSHGLNNIRSRLLAINAKNEFISKPKFGTILNFVLYEK